MTRISSVEPLLWTVPFPRNEYFTGRSEEIEQLRLQLERVRSAGLVQGVTGLGGIGKTQTVTEYAYRRRLDYDAVLWINVDSAEQARSDLMVHAQLLNLPGAHASDPQVALSSFVNWLQGNSNWLLILDNADTPDLARPFLPTAPRGHVVVTSRSIILDALGIGQPILLGVMDRPTAVRFLLARARRSDVGTAELGAASAIAEEVGDLPLALEQAGAYINETGCRFEDYLTSYRKRRLLLLEESPPATGGYDKTIYSTWTPNFAEVQRTAPASADVLRLAAFMAPDFLPDRFLLDGAQELGDAISGKLERFKDDPLSIEDLYRPLVRYGLAIHDRQSRSLTIHRLVLAVLKAQMNPAEQAIWARRTTRALNAAFPSASYDQWPLCDMLLPHAKVVAEHVDRFELTYTDAGTLLNEAAAFMRLRADFDGSARMHAQSLAIRQRDLPPDHKAVAESLNDTACLYIDLYRLEDAAALFRQALDICHQSTPDDDLLITVLNNLGFTYARLGRCIEAEPLLLQAQELGRQVPDADRFVYAVVLNSRAELLLRQGKLDEADTACRQALAIRNEIGNPEKTARTYVTLGEIERRKGNLESADTWFRMALELKTTVYGEEHPDLISSLIRYSVLLRQKGDSGGAQALEIRAERIRARYRLPHYSELDCF